MHVANPVNSAMRLNERGTSRAACIRSSLSPWTIVPLDEEDLCNRAAERRETAVGGSKSSDRVDVYTDYGNRLRAITLLIA